MVTLILWMLLLLSWAYMLNRIGFYGKMRSKLSNISFDTFAKWENRAFNTVLWVIGIGMGINFFRTTQDLLQVWISTFVVGSVVVLGTLYFYKEVSIRLWLVIKEPFRKVDKRDLKWRVIQRLISVRFGLQTYHPGTWAFLVKVGQVYGWTWNLLKNLTGKVVAWTR